MTEDAAGLSLSDAAAAVRDGRLSSTLLTRACLDRIGRLDHRINAYLAVNAEPRWRKRWQRIKR